jgi:hypothetical protein
MTVCSLYRLDPPVSQQNYISFFNECLSIIPEYLSTDFDYFLEPMQDVNKRT